MRNLAGIALLTFFLLVSAVSAYPIFVATGDTASIHENIPGGSCWLFPPSGIGYQYDFSPIVTIENETFCSIPGKTTENLAPGKYTMVYQEPVFVGNKAFKDISWIDNSLVSSFANTRSIDESGKQAPSVMEDLKRLIETNQFNTVNSEWIFIEDPELTINEMGKNSYSTYQIDPTQKNLETTIPLIPMSYWGKYKISGTSNLPDGTIITIKIDEDRYFAQHNNSFTFTTKLIRDNAKPSSSWSYDMPMSINDMPPGWHDITVYAGSMVSTRRFKIDMGIVPTPTPIEYVKYLSDGNIAPVYVTVVQEKIVDHYTDRWVPATPTPAITDALGGKIEYPYKTGEQIPGWVALLALIGIAGLVLVRDWKWK